MNTLDPDLHRVLRANWPLFAMDHCLTHLMEIIRFMAQEVRFGIDSTAWLMVSSQQWSMSIFPLFFWGGDIIIISFLWTHAWWKRLNNSQHLFLTCIHCTCLTDLSDVGIKTYQNHSMPHWTTAEPLDPLDKNRLRILLPTLGFLSAIGGKYGNYSIYERGFPQVLNGLVLNGFIWWGFCRFILEWY